MQSQHIIIIIILLWQWHSELGEEIEKKKIMKLKIEDRLEDVVKLFLSEWSDFQKTLIRLRGIRKRQYIVDVFCFFVMTFTNTASGTYHQLN